MKNKYDIIQQLISLWQEFEWKNEAPDLAGFGLWLSQEKANLSSPESTDDMLESGGIRWEAKQRSPKKK